MRLVATGAAFEAVAAQALKSKLVQEAAVAVVLRGTSAEDAEVLLVRRALKTGDPWSGHMALPGGRRAPEDADLLATALRETHEEVGVQLARDQSIGMLPPVFTVAPARSAPLGLKGLPMIVRPHVLVVASPVECMLSAEVTAVRWVPLAALREPAHRTTRPWRFVGVRWAAPAWNLDGDIVWGLTHQMLTRLVRALV